MYNYKPSFKTRIGNFLWGTIIVIVSLAIALIPTWIFFFFKWLLAPHGFWQNFFLMGIGLYFLGSLQFVLAILWIVFLASFLSE